MIALHAGRSAKAVSDFRKRNSKKPIIVAITGTDLHVQLKSPKESRKVFGSLEAADRIVMLEPEGAKKLPSKLRKKVEVIYQSAVPVLKKPQKLVRFFEVSVIGHLRDVKDPFRIAEAVKLLPKDSRIKAIQLGKPIEPGMEKMALRETRENSRYKWLGAVSHYAAQMRMARSHLTVLTSRVEGAPSTISEAIVNDVPVLATRITSMIGMLGADHPGLFEFGDAERLAELLYKAEKSPAFYRELIAAGRKRKSMYKPSVERKSWQMLIEKLVRV